MSLERALHQRSLLQQAQTCRQRGWSVLPLLPGMKVPAIDWQRCQQQPADEAQIHDWFARRMPRYQLGVVTGPVSRLLVLDFDDLALLDQFARRCPLLVDTCMVETRRGVHLYFHVEPEDMPASMGAPGVDLQAAGRYVVAPPSQVEGHTYTLISEYPPRSLGGPEVAEVVAFVSACRPAPPVELPCEPPQRLTMGDVAACYRRLLPEGRNEALFKAALRARDDGRAKAWALAALVDVHIAAAPPRGHRHQDERSRRREAEATIASAYSRPPRRPKAASVPAAAPPPAEGQGDKSAIQLPTAVRQRLNELRQTAVIRLIHGLRTAGIQPGALFCYSQAVKMLKAYGVGDWSVRCAIHARTPDQKPVFERAAALNPPDPPLKANCVASAPDDTGFKNASFSGSQYQRKVHHRPPILYRMPSNSELAARLSIDHLPSAVIDPIPVESLVSARQTRMACHREFVRERPLQPNGRAHALGFLARRVGVSTVTLKRYNRALEIPAYRNYEEFPLGWDSLARLDSITPGEGGYFLANQHSERFPARRDIAEAQLQRGLRISLFRQRPNVYRYDVLAGPPLDADGRLMRPAPPPRLPIRDYRLPDLPRPAAEVHSRAPAHDDAPAQTAHPPSEPVDAQPPPAPVYCWVCPHCLWTSLAPDQPCGCPKCGRDDWESVPEAVWKDPQRCSQWWRGLCRAHERRKKDPDRFKPRPAHKRWWQPLPDTRQEALAQRIHAALPAYSLANARQTAATTDPRLLELALATLRQRRNIYNPVGFFVTFVRSEKKFGQWQHPKL